MSTFKLNREDRKRFSSQKRILNGTILCRGTRVPLRALLTHLSLGRASHEIQKELPDVTTSHIVAAIRLAAALTRRKARANPELLRRDIPSSDAALDRKA